MDILIVEDEKKIAESLKQGLEETGYEVMVAYDGLMGEKMINNYSFNLVLLDINLPGINGIDLCKKIRQKDKQIPVLMLTTFGSVNDKIDGFDAGADDYLVKPFSFDELIVRIRALIRRTADSNIPVGNILQFADLEMNLDTKMVTRSGKKIRLTAKEFQLLEYLLRNRKRVVSRADIGEHVWNIDFDTQTNTIDVYVNYLRKKIDKGFPQKLIHTQVGFGYVLKENAS
ncbi:MAG: response regulator transcription factor [Chitinophagaceae bacterium]|nr:response regulator transcription factor [Chitinophagaceae bacterium]